MASASNTDRTGKTRSITFPPWPKVDALIYEEDGLSPLEISFRASFDMLSFTGSNADKLVQQAIWPRGPEFLPAFKQQIIVTEQGVVNAGPVFAPMQWQRAGSTTRLAGEDLKKYFERVNVLHYFPQYESVVKLFHPLVLIANEDFREAFGLYAQWARDFPDLAPTIITYSLGWGTIGRGALWGLAAVAGFAFAAAAAPGAAGVAGIAAIDMAFFGTGIFATGYSASVWGEIWTAIEGGGARDERLDFQQTPSGGRR
jgi:hypothetical protein